MTIETFLDRFGKLFLQTTLPMNQILITFCLSLAAGLYIYFVYRFFSKTEFYSRDLNITLAGIVVVVAAIMLAMQANIIVSLGMVGALSIVRFRTAIKNPIDLLYLFWAISEGIICGVNVYVIGILLSAFITVLLFLLGRFPIVRAPVVLIVKTERTADDSEVKRVLNDHSRSFKVKSTVFRNNELETVYEVYTKNCERITEELSKAKGIISFTVLEHSGEQR